MTTSEPDLASWLLEQIAEDERLAQESIDMRGGSGEWSIAEERRVRWGDPSPNPEILAGGKPIAEFNNEYGGPFHAWHAERWDPVRVLAECDAKRQIIDEHTVYQPPPDVAPPVANTDCPNCDMATPCPTSRLLALPFADRPGYRQEWRPA